jgi:hypothetical protein
MLSTLTGALCSTFAATAAVAAIASGAGSPRSTASDWTRLRRPLHLPALQAGDPCPVSRGVKALTLSKDFGSALAVGSGPVYPVVDSSNATRTVGSRPVRGFPSQSYVKAGGCFGYQLDGFGFSRVAVIRVAGF